MRCSLIAASMLLAGAQTLAGAASDGLTDVTTSPAEPVDGGSWHYVLRRSAEPLACGTRDAPQSCVRHALVLHNDSPRTLECRVRVDYRNAAGGVASSFDAPALVLPGTTARVHTQITEASLSAGVRALDCRARTPYVRIPKVPGCKFTMSGDPLETYYPARALQNSSEGPVIVSFELRKPKGHASDPRIAESSLVPDLDNAALAFVNGQRFETACPARYDVVIRFTLRDQILARQ